MKKVKIENINGATGRYLFKRKYLDSESFRKSRLRASQTVEQFMNNASFANFSNAKVVTMQGIPFDSKEAEIQYEKLSSWVSSRDEVDRSQLQLLLFPMFMTVYRYLTHIGNTVGAKGFYTKFLRTLSVKSEMREMATKYCNDSNSSQYRFSVELSQDLFQELLKYLCDHDLHVLIRILNSSIQIVPSDIAVETTKDAESLKIISGSSQESDEVSEALLMLELPQPPPQLKLYTFHTGSRKTCTGTLSADRSAFACGMEDSSVTLGNFTGSHHFESSVSRASLDLSCRLGQFHPGEADLDDHDDQSKTDITFLRGHTGPVYSVNFSNHSAYVLSGSEDTTLRLWSTESSECSTVYRGHTYPVWCSDISPTSQFFASGSMDRTAKIWDFERTYPLRILAGHTEDVDCVQFHPNGMYVATGSSDRSVRMWSITDGHLVRSLIGHRLTVLALAFSPCGKMIASGGEDRKIRIWDVAMSSVLHELSGHNDAVHKIHWLGSTQLASLGDDNTVRLWTLQKNDRNVAVPDQSDCLVASYSFPAHLRLLNFAKSSRNTLLALASSD